MATANPYLTNSVKANRLIRYIRDAGGDVSASYILDSLPDMKITIDELDIIVATYHNAMNGDYNASDHR
jgi:hypothetical protein